MAQNSGAGDPRALAGVRVLHVPHPFTLPAARLLAGLGADVIALEPPGGTLVRAVPPFLDRRPGPDRSLYALFYLAGQRSATLDLARTDAGPLLRRLLDTCAIVLTGGTPTELETLATRGLDPDAARARRPAQIWVQVAGFGLDGPHAHWLAPDLVGVAMSGIMWLAGYPDRAPTMPPWGQGYLAAGLRAAEGAMLALRLAEATGEGQIIEVSMQEALSLAQETAMQTWDMRRELRRRRGDEHIVPGTGTYLAADGYIVSMVGGSRAGAPLLVLLDWLEERGMIGDLRQEPLATFLSDESLRSYRLRAQANQATAEERRLAERADAAIAAFFRVHPRHYLYEEGQRRRLLIAMVHSARDLVENAQLNARGWYQAVPQPTLGRQIVYPGPPFRLLRTPWQTAPAPAPGEHNRDIWGTELGLSNYDLAALAGAGVI